MKLHLPSQSGVTVVENIFIDHICPKPTENTRYLRVLSSPLRGCRKGTVSLVHCRCFRPYGGDVKRALAYWEKLHLLKLQYDGGGKLCDILFLDGDPNRETAASSETDSAPKTEVSVSVPEKSSLSGSGKKRWQARRRSAS